MDSVTVIEESQSRLHPFQEHPPETEEPVEVKIHTSVDIIDPITISATTSWMDSRICRQLCSFISTVVIVVLVILIFETMAKK